MPLKNTKSVFTYEPVVRLRIVGSYTGQTLRNDEGLIDALFNFMQTNGIVPTFTLRVGAGIADFLFLPEDAEKIKTWLENSFVQEVEPE